MKERLSPPIHKSAYFTIEHRRLFTIQVGDIVIVKENETFPADLVLLVTPAASRGKCFVMTSNLDGETNLKPLSVPKAVRNLKVYLSEII